MKKSTSIAVAWTLLVVVALAPAIAQEEAPSRILTADVNVWHGRSDGLEKADVLIEGNLIKGESAI